MNTSERGASGRELTGLLIIVVGIGLLLNTMNIFPFASVVGRYWMPAVFVAIGLVCMSSPRNSGAWMGGMVFIGIGVLMFLARMNLGISPGRLIAPAILMWIGITLLTKHSRPPKPPRPPKDFCPPGFQQETQDSSDFITASAFLGGYDRKCMSQQFQGGDLSAFIGGGKVDLRDAKIAGDGAVIDVFALMGGIELFVPQDWVVENQVTPVLGGCEDTTRHPGPGAKRLTVRGTVIMGGINIKN